jgi:hypothetical protein
MDTLVEALTAAMVKRLKFLRETLSVKALGSRNHGGRAWASTVDAGAGLIKRRGLSASRP